jgi:hypothetical protein
MFCKRGSNYWVSKAPANNAAVGIMPAVTALWFDAVMSVNFVHRV